MPSDKDKQRHNKRQERRLLFGTFAAGGLIALSVYAWVYGAAYVAYWKYEPREGDVIFQSLPRNELVNAIEGATGSPYSHCGIVAKEDGAWVVYEAYRGVSATPLKEFLFRGRGQGFAVYRFKPEHERHIPATLAHCRAYLGRPYDARYRMDDEKIYCSELIYKAYRDASAGGRLGRLVRLGDLNWRPWKETIEHFENGPVPLEREMITPRDLARAEQLELVLSHGIGAAK